MSTDVPLLNDYKRTFVQNRLLQTLLGGIRLTGCPWYALLLQCVLYATPIAFIVAGGVLAGRGGPLEDATAFACLFLGLAVTAYALLLQLVALCINKKDEEEEDGAADADAVMELERPPREGGAAEESSSTSNRRRRAAHHQLFNDEDDVELDGCCSVSTWRFLIPKKKYKLNIALHSLTAGITAAAALHFLDLRVVEGLFDSLFQVYMAWIFGWMAVLNALYSPIIGPPPETATYRALDVYELCHLSRPFHVLLLTLPHFAATYLSAYPNEEGSEKYWHGPEPWIWTSWLTHILLPLMPALWLLGLFPPVEALALWFGEQVQVFALGGSTTSCHARFWSYLAMSLVQLLVLVLIPGLSTNDVVSLASVSGYILSLDLLTLATKIAKNPLNLFKNQVRPSEEGSTKTRHKKPGAANQFAKLSELFLACKEIVSHLVFFSLNVVVVYFVPYDNYKLDTENDIETVGNVTIYGTVTKAYRPLASARDLSPRLLILGWIAVAAYLFLKLTNESQKVYLFFGLVRSPFYSSSNPPMLFLTIWYHLRSLILNFGVGLFLTFYVKSLILEDFMLVWDPMPFWFETLAILRIMRWIWQNSFSALVELAMLHSLLTFFTPLGNYYSFFHFFFHDVSRPVQLLLVGFFRDRLKQFAEKVYFATVLSVSSMEDRANRRSYAGCLFQMNILFSPVILFMITTSSLLSAPMLAFFTLPIFFVAFPRPSKFWPGPIGLQANHSEDSVYYQQMLPSLVSSLHRASRAGRLGIQQPGNQLLARFEDRIVWLQVLEQGNNYCCYGAKGMELQETSCHSLEATRLDDIFESTFEKNSKLNSFAFHTVTPLLTVPVLMHSDTRSALTGVIESPETLQMIARTYLKTLTWYLLKSMTQKRKKSNKLPAASHNPREDPNASPDHVVMFDEAAALAEEDGNPDGGVPPFQFPSSDSIDGVELDEWPTSSDNSPADERVVQPSSGGARGRQFWADHTEGQELRRQSAYQRRERSGSEEEDEPSLLYDQFSDTEEDMHGLSLKRKTLLPPITPKRQVRRRSSIDSFTDKLDNIFLPGGVGEKTPVPERREFHDLASRDQPTTMISPTHQPYSKANGAEQLAERISPSPVWLTMPGQPNLEAVLQNNFSHSWLRLMITKHVTGYLNRSEPSAKPAEEEVQALLDNSAWIEMLRKLIQDCFFVVYGTGSSFDSVAAAPGPALPVRMYKGDLPVSNHSQWVLSEAPDLLERVLVPAFRAAVKLALDQVLIGAFNSEEELEEELADLDENWYLGLESEPGWRRAVLSERPNLFSVSGDGNGRRTSYRQHLLSLRQCDVAVGRVNAEVVKGLWASLNLELLYLTNDDDERYSIQAEERLLRNLTVQVADPPLGYTIFSSDSIRRGIESL